MFKKKRAKDEKASGRLRSLIQKKPSEKRGPSGLFYFVMIILILLVLNFALLLPPQLSTLWFEFEIWIISWLRSPIVFQTWVWLIIGTILWFAGYAFTPFLSIPSTGETYIVRDAWQEGEIAYFKTLSGKILGIHSAFIYSTGAWKLRHYFVVGFVSRIPYEGYILYQSGELEVTRAILAERLAEQLAEENAKYREILKRYEPYLSIEDIERLNVIRTQGGEER